MKAVMNKLKVDSIDNVLMFDMDYNYSYKISELYESHLKDGSTIYRAVMLVTDNSDNRLKYNCYLAVYDDKPTQYNILPVDDFVGENAKTLKSVFSATKSCIHQIEDFLRICIKCIKDQDLDLGR